ncbi:MAG: Zn-dependent oxidoreductase, partial [Sphingomonadaceae bacterium]
HVFDYRALSVQAEIVAALRGRQVAGAITVGKGAAAACLRVLAQCEGRRFVAQASAPASLDDVPATPGRWRKLVPALASMVVGGIALSLLAKRCGLKTKMIWGGSLIDNEVGRMIYGEFLPEALSKNVYTAAPPPLTVGHGLACIPEAMVLHGRGVSARKLVVTL